MSTKTGTDLKKDICVLLIRGNPIMRNFPTIATISPSEMESMYPITEIYKVGISPLIRKERLVLPTLVKGETAYHPQLYELLHALRVVIPTATIRSSIVVFTLLLFT